MTKKSDKAGPGGPASKRGRPRKLRPLIPRHGQGLMAVDLFIAEAELRVSPAEARRRITARWRVGNEDPRKTRERIKAAARRYPESREIVRGAHHLRTLWNELARRMSGCPDDVAEWLNSAPAVWLLEFCRKADIDMNCPEWVVEAARRDDWEPLLDLMSPK